MKELFIAEKPSVAQQFADALSVDRNKYKRDGYIETEQYIFTWCVGHLVSMSYPEAYDERLRRWRFDTLPFIPGNYLYEVIPSVKKQFSIVEKLLRREDIACIYVCTDSGREGEYIYRLVSMQAGVKHPNQKRVWIDSQTREEILRGIREAKPESDYDAVAAAAYSRAKEDYLMGINFSRVLTLRYGREVSRHLGKEKNTVIAVGRVMTCVLGMIVRREQEILNFRKTGFYKVNGSFVFSGETVTAAFRKTEASPHYEERELYRDNGFLEEEAADRFIASFSPLPREASVSKVQKKKESRNAPLLYNLAELQNDCARRFKISPEETLEIAQELYEKKLTTYPRTDARVLSSAVSREISGNLRGIGKIPGMEIHVSEIFENGWEKKPAARYVNDAKITDHYAIIPTGDSSSLKTLKPLSKRVYALIVRRFLSIFYPPAVYQKLSVELLCQEETFVVNQKLLQSPGYLKIYENPREETAAESEEREGVSSLLLKLKKGQQGQLVSLEKKEGETQPPKRYTSGSMILAMENAGNLIEDDELRAQIKGSGIGTSATRAGILTKLQRISYIRLEKKTQLLSPTRLGTMITQVVQASIPRLLNPELTASWEKGLSYVSEGKITEAEYMEKLERFVRKKTEEVKRR